MKKELPNFYVINIEDIYEEASTNLMIGCGQTENFNVRVCGECTGEGPTLSPHTYFSWQWMEIRKYIQSEALWCMLFSDNTMLKGKGLAEVNNRLVKRRELFGGKGLRIRRNKT